MSSSAPNSSDTEDFKPDVNPVSPLKTSKTPPKTPSPAKKAKKSSGGGGANNGEWTPEKKAVFMDRVVGSGYKNLDLGALSEELGLAKRQLIDQLVPGRKNLRGKAVQAAKGE